MPKAQNIDKFGFCISCNKYLLKNVVLNGKQEAQFTPHKDEIWLKLNTGSMMSISVCKHCKKTVDFNDPVTKAQILEAVQNGWTLEMDLMSRQPNKYPDFNLSKRNALETLYSSIADYNHIKGFKFS